MSNGASIITNPTLKKYKLNVDDLCFRFDPWTCVNNWAVDELTGAGSRRITAVNTAAVAHAALSSHCLRSITGLLPSSSQQNP